MRKWLALLALLLGSAVMAQAKVSPQGIIVNPSPGDLAVKVWVNKDPHRTGRAVYQIGEPIRISVTVNHDAYVYLFNVNSDGTVNLILPNAYDRNNFLRAEEVRTYPPDKARYRFTISGPEGESYVLALASLRPLPLSGLADVRTGRVNVRGLQALSSKLSVVVEPLPNNEWATDALRYYVGRQAPPPPPATGTLQVSSTPSGAKVYVDGSLRGQTPLTLSLAPGFHDVELRMAGYEPYRARVQVKSGQTTRVSARLVPVPRTGVLKLDSNPPGAEVYLNGALIGRTPMQISLDEGTYDIELRLDGYMPYETRVRINAGQTTRLNPRLQPVPRTGTLEVTSDPSGAEVYVDGVYRGRTRLVLELDAGPHEVEVRMSGYESYRARVNVQPNRTTRLDAPLIPIKATLDLNVNVDKAKVFLDGYLIGETTDGRLVVEVTPGERELVIIAPGYHAFVRTVRLESGGYHRVSVWLTPLE